MKSVPIESGLRAQFHPQGALDVAQFALARYVPSGAKTCIW
jgi:hypothetical protein